MTVIASRSQLRMAFLRYALVTVPAVLLLGVLSGRLADSGYDNMWFAALVKPALMPPGWVFGAAWTFLYILMGLALALVLHARGARGRGIAIGLFVVQLLLNYLWSPIFFGWHKVGLALILIIAILLLAIATTAAFWRVRRVAALMLLPYLAWLGFASWLNYQVRILNPDAETLAPGAQSTDIAL